MGRSEFGRVLAVLGMLTGAIGIFSETLRPMIGPAYVLYGLLLPLWFALVGRALLRLGRIRPTTGSASRAGQPS